MWMKLIDEQRKLVTWYRLLLNHQLGGQCPFLTVPFAMAQINQVSRIATVDPTDLIASERWNPVEIKIKRCQPAAEMSDLAMTVLHLLCETNQGLRPLPTAMVMKDTLGQAKYHLEDDETLEFRTETQENEALSEGCLEDLAIRQAKMSFTGLTTGDVRDLKICIHHPDTQMNEDDGMKIEVDVDIIRMKKKWRS